MKDGREVNLEEGIHKVHQQLQDPVEGSQPSHVDIDVAHVGDGEVGQLETAAVHYVHLAKKCWMQTFKMLISGTAIVSFLTF